MVDNLILVVLYNKKIEDSATLMSLLACNTVISSKVIVWNNGPNTISLNDFHEKFEDHGYQFEYVEALNNSSLAMIYNNVLNIPATRYIILDHDSTLNDEYLSDIVHISSNEVGMPKIYSGDALVNPCVNMLPIFNLSKVLPGQLVTTIGSGLVIGNGIASSIRNKFGDVFDERFMLYGVDTTFCYRLHNLHKKNVVKIINGFKHSLSRLESNIESKETLMFRKKERSCDLGLRIRFYKNGRFKELTSLILSFCKRFILRREQQYSLYIVFYCLFTGAHIRNN